MVDALAPARTVAPAEALLSLDDAKEQLRVTASDEDALITALIATAEGYLDGWSGVLGQALVTQTWEQSFSGFPAGDIIRLPLGPLQSVSSVAYYDEAGDEQTFSSANYRAVTDVTGPMIVLDSDASWPSTYDRPDAVTITWVCGHGAAADVPMPIIHAAKLMISHWFNAREAAGAAMSEIPFGVDLLLCRLRKVTS